MCAHVPFTATLFECRGSGTSLARRGAGWSAPVASTYERLRRGRADQRAGRDRLCQSGSRARRRGRERGRRPSWRTGRGMRVSRSSWSRRRPGRPSVVATARGSGGGRSLLLCGHLDTVGTGAMEAPFEPRIEGDRLHGRGAYDMKAGVAAALVACRDAAALELAGRRGGGRGGGRGAREPRRAGGAGDGRGRRRDRDRADRDGGRDRPQGLRLARGRGDAGGRRTARARISAWTRS